MNRDRHQKGEKPSEKGDRVGKKFKDHRNWVTVKVTMPVS